MKREREREREINRVKKYWNNQPCNINHSKKEFLSRDYFNEIEKKRYFIESHIPKFANFKKYKNKNVLEIGCGIGTDGVQFLKNGANYTGVELSKNSLDIFRERIKILGLSNLKSNLILSNCESLKNVPKLNYNLIYSFGVIHHTPNMKKAFEEIYKLSNKKTEIKIMLYAKNSYKNFMLDITNYRYEAQKNCPVVYKSDISDVKKLIKNKFKILEISQDFIFPYQIKPYKNNIYKKIEHFDCMPPIIFNKLSKKIGEHLLIKLKKI
jgi:ubiquinone/menaquinone biosynthesis C-methylase UbiE